MNRHPLPVIALLFAMLFWGSSFIALKIAFTTHDPMQVIFWRMAIATLLFLPLLPRFLKIRIKTGDVKLLGLMTLFEPCLYFIFEAKALEQTTASQAGMITAILPLLVAVGAALWLKEPVTRQNIVGFLLAIAGAWWLSLSGESSETAPNPQWGNFLEFLAMLCAAGYILTLKRLTARYSPLFLTALQALAGTLFFLPALFITPTPAEEAFNLTALLAVLYLGSIVTVGAYGLYNYGVSKIPVSQASAYINLIPVFAVLLGFLILGESFTQPQILASLLVFIGVITSQWGSQVQRKAKRLIRF
ncbi:MAG: DMT family transporter [Gammaproteobacteria bacterium]|nr:DMT family transporter [Gammaproteobacteria bacterium]